MFHLLDDTLTALLSAAPSTLVGTAGPSISFLTPDKSYSTNAHSSIHEINLFLYEVKENRELRNAAPNIVQQNNSSLKRRQPLRVDCTYMVTAWCTDGVTPHNKTNDSHKLLGQAFNWLSRFPVIPDDFLRAAGLTNQLYSAPTMVAQMDGAKSAGEFWSALGIPPRPYFNIVITICMDLDQQIEDHLVTTVSSAYSASGIDESDARMIIGGTVRNSSGESLPNVWVRIEELNVVQVTDSNGRFVFENVVPSGGLNLVARANGLGEISRTIDIPSVSGDYDLSF
ncbi:MAG: Pvc16 family protein [Pseudomonadota bacterium]